MTARSTPMRQLALYADDGRPDTALAKTFLTPAGIIGGFASIVLIVLGSTVLILLTIVVQQITDAITGEDEEEIAPVLEEEDIVEARFVVLGRDFLDELPNRVVPRLSTAPPPPSQVPTEATPDNPEDMLDRPEDAPPDAVTDAITRIGDRAQAFAEIAEEREREGSAEGIEEGTEQEGTEGDIYRGRLYAFFRRGWSIPTTLNREEAQNLVAIVDVHIGANLELVRFEIRNSSGNPLFDESVIQQLTRLQAADQHIPPPPEDVASQYIGQAIAVRFRGREAS